ncbi:lytic transglycosylase domain-containing protein [Streptomyces sp. NPDC046805]|uniref:lytic transglycosylase domain-containing protein n=1 Tax=Streptomyces sp. NPDC046805 TaxID=3155134 RepID=UPI0033D0FFDA
MIGAPLPATVLDAYTKAEASLAQSAPGCNLPWQLLAAIGQVESGQAWGGRVSADGTTRSPILGPPLNGHGFAAIADTDGGLYDGDSRYDRAVGPMQFIPSTWATWGADGNRDGRADPDNVYDATLAAGRYLCAGGRDLSRPQDVDQAILGYNHSAEYLRIVKAWFAYFRTGHYEVPDSTESGPYPSPDSSRGSSAPSPSPSESTRPKPSRPSSPRPTPSPTPSGSGGGGGTGHNAPSPGTASKPPGADGSPIRVPGLKTVTDTVAGLVTGTPESCTLPKVPCAR